MIVKRVAVVLSTLVVVLFGRAAAPAAANQRTLVVDDDRQQSVAVTLKQRLKAARGCLGVVPVDDYRPYAHVASPLELVEHHTEHACPQTVQLSANLLMY